MKHRIQFLRSRRGARYAGRVLVPSAETLRLTQPLSVSTQGGLIMTNRRRSATTRSVPAQTPQQLLGLAQEHIRPLIGVIDRLNEADAEDERRVISKQLTRLCFKGAEPCLRVGPCKPAPPAFNNGIRIPGLGSLA